MAKPLFAVAAAFAVLDGALASKTATDPCAKIAGRTFVAPAEALACYKTFAFNTTLQNNVVSAVGRVFDFYTFEDYYYKSPPPFQESTVNIRGELARIGKTNYATDYDFNLAVSNLTTSLNDGHTAWFPSCYQAFENLLATPIAILEINGKQGVYVVPDLVDFLPLVGDEFLAYFKKLGFNWQRLAGAEVLEIEGQNVWDYIDYIAHTQSGNYLDHGVRVNSVVSSYRIQSNGFSQRFGDLGGSLIIEKPGLHMKLIPANSTKAETLFVPYAAEYTSANGNFTDSASFWAVNCAATDDTNGADYYPDDQRAKAVDRKFRPKASIVDNHNASAVGLPTKYQPSVPPVGGSGGVVKSYILPGNTTGVMFVGSFEPDDYAGFQTDVDSAVKAMKAAGVTKLLIDLTNNGGGYICLGQFLATYLAGTNTAPYGGFQSTLRANPLAKKILANQIARGEGGYYYPNDFAFLNDTVYPDNYNYYKPSNPTFVNARPDATSQRFHDVCTPYDITMPKEAPFALKNVAIVGNSNCASTCSLFSTVMFERFHIKIAAVGGKPGERMEYKGMAGNQVLEFADLKSEIKTAHLNNDSLAPPDLLVNGNMRVNWRTAWSYFNEAEPIAYVSEPAIYRFPYTPKTYNNPQALWTEAAQKLLA